MSVAAAATHPPAQVSGRAWLLGLAFAWVVSCAYVFHGLDRNWIPHDDGLLAQAAERVLLGEVPHRDFAEVYTGGLDYLNAIGFTVFGMHLMALRYVLFAFFVVWVPVLYYCASRFLAPLGAMATTLLSVVWTVPNYPAAMPSWYNLFFATFGAAALLRFAEVRQRRWLLLAGLMGGCSVLGKITGLYYVAAGLLFLLVDEALTQPPNGRSPAGRGYRWPIALGLLGFVVALALLLRRHLTPEHVYHFLLPGAGLAVLTWRVVARSGNRPAAERFARLASVGWPFLLGLAIPIVIFAAPYLTKGDLDALLRGLFVSPTTRFVAASRSPIPWPTIVPAALLGITLVLASRARSGIRAWLVAGLLAVMLLATATIGGTDYLYGISWASISQAIPLVIIMGLLVLVRRTNLPAADVTRWEQSFLLLAVAGLTSLIEYAFAAPVYFCYTAPLTLLALVGLLRLTGGPPQPLTAFLAVYYGAFAVVGLNAQSVGELGLTAARGETLARLELPRGRVLVHARDAVEYEAAVDTLTAHARGRYTYAGPDAPEIYFLTGLRNPTRAFFEFLEPARQSADSVLAAVDRHGVTAVVINRDMKFSPPLSPELEVAFARRFPHATTVGKFMVRWQ
jgi:Dolichyl-phosphate-mannose-protein mannosyltransferase